MIPKMSATAQGLRRKPVDDQWELGESGGTLQIVADAERAGGALFTLVVDDLAAEIADACSRPLPDAPAEGVVVTQVTTVTDPDGSTITPVQ